MTNSKQDKKEKIKQLVVYLGDRQNYCIVTVQNAFAYVNFEAKNIILDDMAFDLYMEKHKAIYVCDL